MTKYTEKELFETVPVPRAVATLAIPTVISQVVAMVYNLADTFFIGQIGNPYMVAAVSLVFPWFNLLTALGNLFGIGGSSLISRLLGEKRGDEVRFVSAFSIWGGAVLTLVFSVLTYLARTPILHFLGASPDTYGYAERYLFWVVVLGGVPTMASQVFGHLLRSEGYVRPASAGMMFGGILNVVLDPILIFGMHLDVAGAAIATAVSNALSVVFFFSSMPGWETDRWSRSIRGISPSALSGRSFRSGWPPRWQQRWATCPTWRSSSWRPAMGISRWRRTAWSKRSTSSR